MERGRYPLFFFGGKMFINLLCLFSGMVIMWCLSTLLSLGHSVVIINQTQRSVAAMFIQSEQGLQEILQLKYIAMEEAKRTKQNITAQQYIDQLNIDSIKNSVMRNYISVFPESYSHLIKFRTWSELENYVNSVTVKEKEEKYAR
tara:strand:+ start:124 stop:558 length:435 start_codon:yes stop_codon:yes gene_type:complete